MLAKTSHNRPFFERELAALHGVASSEGVGPREEEASGGSDPVMARRNKWTDPEVSVLIQGMRRHAGTPNMWASIAREGRLPPWRRPVDLKDKARNLGLIPEPSDVEAPRRRRGRCGARYNTWNAGTPT